MIEIRDLVDLARQQPTDANIEALWKAVFLLRAWYLMPARPEDPNSYPLVTLVDGQAWLLAFTNFRRLRDMQRSIGRAGDSKMLMLDPGQAMDQILSVRKHIRGVIFNPESDESFRCEVDALEAYARHFGLDV
jgi:hypothetical protein